MFLTKNLLFIHIPKSAGTSIVHLLEKNFLGQKNFSIDTHSSYDVFKKNFPELVVNKKTFCIVRNPYCRFVSIYRFINREVKLKKWFGSNYSKISTKIDTFEKFIENFEFPEKMWGDNNQFTNQIIWSNNVENVFKIEEKNKLCSFLKDVGVVGDLPILNSRQNPSWVNNLYREYYNENTKKIIKKKFKDDLEFFGYNF